MENPTEEVPATLITTSTVPAPPPAPSPLSGGYLLIVIGEPHCEEHTQLILQRLAKGFLSWDSDTCHVDLEKELSNLASQAPDGEEARNGERLIQFASETLVTEVLIHPQTSTLLQCVRNLLSSFTRHRHIIHAGYTFAGNGSWALQDGTFSVVDFLDAIQEPEAQRVIRAYENSVSVDIHCSPEGEWSTARLKKESFTKGCQIRVNPDDRLSAGSEGISSFTKYISTFITHVGLEQLLEPSDVVGNIRFSHPTLYVFPGGQGDAALFGINGFNMLVDGGFSRKSCFWDFTRHLDRLDAVLVTRLNNSNINGISSILKRKKLGHVYPQIGHFFCNVVERKSLPSPDGDKDKDPLLIDLLEEGHELVTNLRHLELKPHACYRDIVTEPINLYHKVGHGKLDMYVISPVKESKEVREFLIKWNTCDQKLFTSKVIKGDVKFPLQNMVSICALLVWQPANPTDTITRILFPGSTPQHKIFEGLEKLKHLEFLKYPVCTTRSLQPITAKQKAKLLERTSPESKLIKATTPMQQEIKVASPEQKITKSFEKSPKISAQVSSQATNGKTEKSKTSKSFEKSQENVDKIKNEKNREHKEAKGKLEALTKSEPKSQSKPKSQAKPQIERKVQRTPSAEKRSEKTSSPTPKRPIESKVKSETKTQVQSKPRTKSSPTATPAKSAKEANNRKVVESKLQATRAVAKPPEQSTSATKSVEKKYTYKRPKPSSPQRSAKIPASPTKSASAKSTPTQSVKSEKDGIVKSDKLVKITNVITDEVPQFESQVSTPSTTEIPKARLLEDNLTAESTEEIIENVEVTNIETAKDIVKELNVSEEEIDELVVKDDEPQSADDMGKEDIEEAKETTSIVDSQLEEETEEDVELDKKLGDTDDRVSDIEARDSDIEDEVLKSDDGEVKHVRDEEESEKERKSKDLEELIESKDIPSDAMNDEPPDSLESSEKLDAPLPVFESGECKHKEPEVETLIPDPIISEETKEKIADEVTDIICSAQSVVANQSETNENVESDVNIKPESAESEEKNDISSERMKEELTPDDDKKDQKAADDGTNTKSQPDEKISAMETSATTAPSMPEDERIPLDEIKEGIEEKHVKEETKERDVVEKKDTEQHAIKLLPEVVASVPYDQQVATIAQRDIVKTPDEVADLPMHEEVDATPYEMPEYSKLGRRKEIETAPSHQLETISKDQDKAVVNKYTVDMSEEIKKDVDAQNQDVNDFCADAIDQNLESTKELPGAGSKQSVDNILDSESKFIDSSDLNVSMTSTVDENKPKVIVEALKTEIDETRDFDETKDSLLVVEMKEEKSDISIPSSCDAKSELVAKSEIPSKDDQILQNISDVKNLISNNVIEESINKIKEDTLIDGTEGDNFSTVTDFNMAEPESITKKTESEEIASNVAEPTTIVSKEISKLEGTVIENLPEAIVETKIESTQSPKQSEQSEELEKVAAEITIESKEEPEEYIKSETKNLENLVSKVTEKSLDESSKLQAENLEDTTIRDIKETAFVIEDIEKNLDMLRLERSSKFDVESSKNTDEHENEKEMEVEHLNQSDTKITIATDLDKDAAKQEENEYSLPTIRSDELENIDSTLQETADMEATEQLNIVSHVTSEHKSASQSSKDLFEDARHITEKSKDEREETMESCTVTEILQSQIEMEAKDDHEQLTAIDVKVSTETLEEMEHKNVKVIGNMTIPENIVTSVLECEQLQDAADMNRYDEMKVGEIDPKEIECVMAFHILEETSQMKEEISSIDKDIEVVPQHGSDILVSQIEENITENVPMKEVEAESSDSIEHHEHIKEQQTELRKIDSTQEHVLTAEDNAKADVSEKHVGKVESSVLTTDPSTKSVESDIQSIVMPIPLPEITEITTKISENLGSTEIVKDILKEKLECEKVSNLIEDNSVNEKANVVLDEKTFSLEERCVDVRESVATIDKDGSVEEKDVQKEEERNIESTVMSEKTCPLGSYVVAGVSSAASNEMDVSMQSCKQDDNLGDGDTGTEKNLITNETKHDSQNIEYEANAPTDEKTPTDAKSITENLLEEREEPTGQISLQNNVEEDACTKNNEKLIASELASDIMLSKHVDQVQSKQDDGNLEQVPTCDKITNENYIIEKPDEHKISGTDLPEKEEIKTIKETQGFDDNVCKIETQCSASTDIIDLQSSTKEIEKNVMQISEHSVSPETIESNVEVGTSEKSSKVSDVNTEIIKSTLFNESEKAADPIEVATKSIVNNENKKQGLELQKEIISTNKDDTMHYVSCENNSAPCGVTFDIEEKYEISTNVPAVDTVSKSQMTPSDNQTNIVEPVYADIEEKVENGIDQNEFTENKIIKDTMQLVSTSLESVEKVAALQSGSDEFPKTDTDLIASSDKVSSDCNVNDNRETSIILIGHSDRDDLDNTSDHQVSDDVKSADIKELSLDESSYENLPLKCSDVPIISNIVRETTDIRECELNVDPVCFSHTSPTKESIIDSSTSDQSNIPKENINTTPSSNASESKSDDLDDSDKPPRPKESDVLPETDAITGAIGNQKNEREATILLENQIVNDKLETEIPPSRFSDEMTASSVESVNISDPLTASYLEIIEQLQESADEEKFCCDIPDNEITKSETLPEHNMITSTKIEESEMNVESRNGSEAHRKLKDEDKDKNQLPSSQHRLMVTASSEDGGDEIELATTSDKIVSVVIQEEDISVAITTTKENKFETTKDESTTIKGDITNISSVSEPKIEEDQITQEHVDSEVAQRCESSGQKSYEENVCPSHESRTSLPPQEISTVPTYPAEVVIDSMNTKIDSSSVPLSSDLSNIKDEKCSSDSDNEKLLTTNLRSCTPTSDSEHELAPSTPHSDISSGQISRVAHQWDEHRPDSRHSDISDKDPHSPVSSSSQNQFTFHAKDSSAMVSSFYGTLPDNDDHIQIATESSSEASSQIVGTDQGFSTKISDKEENLRNSEIIDIEEFPQSSLTHAQDISSHCESIHSTLQNGSSNNQLSIKEKTEDRKEIEDKYFEPESSEKCVELPTESSTSKSQAFAEKKVSPDVSKSHEGTDPIADWGKPLGLPSPAPPVNNSSSDIQSSGRGTPKKEKKYTNTKKTDKAKDAKTGKDNLLKTKQVENPMYFDLAYVPHNGNSNYTHVDFFKKVRARYYVFSGLDPSREVYSALLEAKETWDEKELEVTIIPTYDTDTLGYWVAENEEALSQHKIDLSPSASRCTINLQDHETSCSAYRLEF